MFLGTMMLAKNKKRVANVRPRLSCDALMLSAKDRGYDTVAMSGFKTEAVRKLFNIEDHLVNGLIIPIGKAQTPGFETVRRDVSEVVTWLD